MTRTIDYVLDVLPGLVRIGDLNWDEQEWERFRARVAAAAEKDR